MSLPHALLTSLLEKSTSGFDLSRRFSKSIGFFWWAKHQQIYRELARMEKAGWIESYVPYDAGRTRKKSFRVRREGREELENWGSEPAPVMEPRDVLALKLRASAALDSLDMEPELRRHLAFHEGRLRTYRAIAAADFPGNPISRRQAIQKALLRGGILLEESQIAWMHELLASLDAPNARRKKSNR